MRRRLRISHASVAVPITALRVGDRVYTLDTDGERVTRPVTRIGSVPVTGTHAMTVVTLSDGREVRASAGHPLALGAGTLGALSPGDRLDGAEVVAVRSVPYDGARTWDVLPAGPTGAYWANAVLIGSTLIAR